jgi:hypothetical protein
LLFNVGAMKSAFGSKRKPRKIEVDEDDDGVDKVNITASELENTRMSPSCVFAHLADIE